MAFPKLSEREIYGLLLLGESASDVATILKNLENLESSKLLDDEDRKVLKPINDALKESSKQAMSKNSQGDPTPPADEISSFINGYVVKRIPLLVSNYKVQDLEKNIEIYQKHRSAGDYFLWTRDASSKFFVPQFKMVAESKTPKALNKQSVRQDVYSIIGDKGELESQDFISSKVGKIPLDFAKETFFQRLAPFPEKLVGGEIFPKRKNSANTFAAFPTARGEITLLNLLQNELKIVANSSYDNMFIEKIDSADINLSQLPTPSEGYFEKDTFKTLIPSEQEEILQLIYNRERKNFSEMYTPEELAKIFTVYIALRKLRLLTKLVTQLLRTTLDEEGEKAELLNSKIDEIFDAVNREFEENPDLKSLSEAESEAITESIKRGFKIRPQCILIKNILELAKSNRRRLNAVFSDTTTDYEIDYKYTRMVSNPSNTAATINKLTKRESQENLLKMRPHHLARMVPYLRLYKVITDSDGNTNEIEFKFPNFTNVSSENKKMDILEGITNKFTQEYGINSFNWKFIGSDPFSYANDIEASLSIHFNDFEQLMIEREGTLEGQKDATEPKKQKYRILDLVSISELEQAKLKEIGSRFDIRVDVGWSGPSDPSQIEGYNTESSIRTMFLVMTDYDISFNEEGHFELIINYKSRLEQALYDRKTNILVPSQSSTAQISAIEDELEELKASSDQSVETIREKEQKLEDLRLNSKSEAYQNIFNFLLQNNSVFSQDLTADQLFGKVAMTVSGKDVDKDDGDNSEGWYIFGRLATRIEDIKRANREGEAEDPTKKDKTSFNIVTKDDGNYILNYFFLGDLVESLAQKCFEPGPKRSKQEQKFLDDTRIVLTDFLLYDPKDLANKNVLKINIGDIPISVELFMSFYYERVIKYNVGSYSLMKFIRDIISYCITNIFEECFGEDNLKTDIKTGFIDFQKIKSSYKTDSADPFEYYAVRENGIAILKLGEEDLGESYKYDSSTGLRSSISKAYLDLTNSDSVPKMAARDERANCIHACIISAESFEKSQLIIDPNYEDKRAKDISAGLYHLDTGSGRGILKKINFSKTDQKYLREQRFTQDEAKGFSILSNVFDVNMSLVGNTLFFPGQRVFIKLGERFSALDVMLPTATGMKPTNETFATTMGLGGYHLVISVENEISTSGFTTNLVARYEWHGREVLEAKKYGKIVLPKYAKTGPKPTPATSTEKKKPYSYRSSEEQPKPWEK